MIDQEPSMRGFAKEVVKEFGRLSDLPEFGIASAGTVGVLFGMAESGDPERHVAADIFAITFILFVLSRAVRAHEKSISQTGQRSNKKNASVSL